MIKEEDEDGDSRQGEEQLRGRYEELCSSLNMDERAKGEAWDHYSRISQNYTLEGNAMHWLACALYVACRQTVPTVGQGTVEGNYVSLTRILSSSELSLIEFFNKMKKWADMVDLPDAFRQKTDKLERNFTVSAVLFQKYGPIFQEIFKNPLEEQPRQYRSRKQRRQPCTVSELFQFCWVLYIYAKGNFPMISDDSVNSFHLLLCAFDLIYGNALQCPNRRELLNPTFTGLPEEFSSKDYKPPAEPPCIIETLCSLHNGLPLEAKGIKEHFWKPYIRKLFDKKLLRGKSETLIGFLDPGHFVDSVKTINKAYEGYVLSVGSLDERVFLEDTEEEIGSVSHCMTSAPGIESPRRAQLKQNLQEHFDMMGSLRISTPLSSVNDVRSTNSPNTPVSTVSRLFAILSGHQPAPSERLLQVLRACARDSTQAISQRLNEMWDTFREHVGPEEEDSPTYQDIAQRYFRLAKVLYYKVLEVIICQEKERLGDIDLSTILEKDLFHRSLLACCLEIIFFSYKPPGNFPQIIIMFNLAPYDFYKVIEVFIKAEDGLCREMVKHLKHIEEQVLESMAWTTDSALWEKIKENNDKIPLCEEVMQPHHFEQTPVTPRRVNEIRAEAVGIPRSLPSSPATLIDRYNSPAAGTARRRLFTDAESPSDAASSPLASPHTPSAVVDPATTTTPMTGQTLVTMGTATVTANNGQTVTIPVQDSYIVHPGIANRTGGFMFLPLQVNMSGQTHNVTNAIQPLTAQTLSGPLTSQQIQVTSQVTAPVSVAQVPSSPRRPNRTGSFALFCRKVYHLASVRLRDLCQKLDISVELRKKIWTCFEHSLVNFPEMMKDRHLDQLLMCAAYVMPKVTKEEASFYNIMKCYRTQPHARSNVYRSVLLQRRMRRSSGDSNRNVQPNSPQDNSRDHGSREPSPVMRSSSTLPAPQPNSAPPTPPHVAGVNWDMEENQRGDLVQFYNSIYIEKIQSFAKRYSNANLNEATPLSPYPSMRILSPRRVQFSQSYQIYISPHNEDAINAGAHDKMCYYIDVSPAKKLQDINNMVRTGETPTKKRGFVLEDGSESPAKRICQENHTALLRRLRDVANDRGSL
ncbi:retinoblastoma-like protein 2 [Pelodytes ibericus]